MQEITDAHTKTCDFDTLRSTSVLTDDSGVISDIYRYAAFGELVDSTGITPNKYLFTGQQFDALTGQYSLRARYYAPSSGRFLSYDTWPINTQNPVELNRYVYAAGNPVRYTDPSGYSALTEYVSDLKKTAIGSIGGIKRQQVLQQSMLGFVLGGAAYILGIFFYNIQSAEDVEIDAADLIRTAATGAFLTLANFVTSKIFGDLRNAYKDRLPRGEYDFYDRTNQYNDTKIIYNFYTSLIAIGLVSSIAMLVDSMVADLILNFGNLGTGSNPETAALGAFANFLLESGTVGIDLPPNISSFITLTVSTFVNLAGYCPGFAQPFC